MQHKVYKLKDIAAINSGFSFRGKIQNDPGGNTYVVQMRDISDDRAYIANEPHRVFSSHTQEKHLLQANDILFMAKGANNFSVCYNEVFKPAIASSAFFVIRPNPNLVLSKFLCCYINSSKAQAFIESNRAGTYIPNVNKKVLANMDIIIPAFDKQQLIADLCHLTKQEQNLLEQIKEKRAVIMNSILNNLISNRYGN